MGVQLNIKDRATAELARSLAAELNKSVTETVREALEEKRRRQDAVTAERIRVALEIARESAKLWHPDTVGIPAERMSDFLYDEHGLPT